MSYLKKNSHILRKPSFQICEQDMKFWTIIYLNANRFYPFAHQIQQPISKILSDNLAIFSQSDWLEDLLLFLRVTVLMFFKRIDFTRRLMFMLLFDKEFWLVFSKNGNIKNLYKEMLTYFFIQYSSLKIHTTMMFI